MSERLRLETDVQGSRVMLGGYQMPDDLKPAVLIPSALEYAARYCEDMAVRWEREGYLHHHPEAFHNERAFRARADEYRTLLRSYTQPQPVAATERQEK